MRSTQGNPSVYATSLSIQKTSGEPNDPIALPKVTQLTLGRMDGGGEEAEQAADDSEDAIAGLDLHLDEAAKALEALNDSIALSAREQRLVGHRDVVKEAEFKAPSDANTSPFERPRITLRRWRNRSAAVGFAILVAVAATVAVNTPISDAPRDLALALIPVATASPADQPAAGDDEAEASRGNWSDRAAQLATPAIASSADVAAVGTATAAVATQASSVAQANATSPAPAPAAAGAIRGLSDKEIRFGLVAPFSGASKELGHQMKIGIETAFDQVDETGGVNGRQLRLNAADDGYEPTRTADAMQQLYDKDQAFGFIGNVGTPTAAVALPFALDHRLLFFGAFTGGNILRRDPPDRYVFNYRASYAEETDAVVRYLVKVRRIQPRQILVFAQQDAYGDSGYSGVAKAVRALPGNNPDVVRVGYKRNTVDVQDAVAQLRAYKGQIKAVVMVASYRAAAKFIEKTRDLYPDLIYTNVSFVGSTALADELSLLGSRYAAGVIVTQVVPAVNSYASVILKYKAALAKYFPGETPDYVSLEGYIDGCILAEAVRRVGAQIDTEKLVDEIEHMHDFDMGLGTPVTFSPNDHQGSHKVWGTQLDEKGQYQAIDLQ